MNSTNIKLEYATVCTACKRTKRREDLLYSVEDFKPYCSNIGECVDEHPNSYLNFGKTQKTVKMVPYGDANELFRQQFRDTASEEDIKALDIVNRSITVRIQTLEMAKYFLRLKDKLGIDSNNVAMLKIIEDHMNLGVNAELLANIEVAVQDSAKEFEQKKEEQHERIEELQAVNKPVYVSDDEDEDVI